MYLKDQGLGPLLSLIFVNDMMNTVEHGSRIKKEEGEEEEIEYITEQPNKQTNKQQQQQQQMQSSAIPCNIKDEEAWPTALWTHLAPGPLSIGAYFEKRWSGYQETFGSISMTEIVSGAHFPVSGAHF